MKRNMKITGAVGIAAVVAAGGFAFTASNSLPAGGVSGYGQSVATGATVTGITNNLVPTDHSKLASVTFLSTTDLTGKIVTMTLKQDTTVVGTPYACTVTGVAPATTITCLTPGTPGLETYDTTGLTVI
jgi:hypothetical protein